MPGPVQPMQSVFGLMDSGEVLFQTCFAILAILLKHAWWQPTALPVLCIGQCLRITLHGRILPKIHENSKTGPKEM